jgi:hypothetical protein
MVGALAWVVRIHPAIGVARPEDERCRLVFRVVAGER